jgi:hypothetical protein
MKEIIMDSAIAYAHSFLNESKRTSIHLKRIAEMLRTCDESDRKQGYFVLKEKTFEDVIRQN